MYNKLLKGGAAVLGAALVLGSVVMGALPAQAKTISGKKATYTPQELVYSADDAYRDATIANADNGAITASLPQQYSHVFFEIPAEVLEAGWEQVEFELESEGDYAIKLDDHGQSNGTIRGLVWRINDTLLVRSADYIDPYGSGDDPVPTEDDLGKANLVSIMNMMDGANTVTFKSVTFTTQKDIAGGEAADSGNAADPSSDTGESTTLLWVVCALGGLFLISATGMFVTEKKRR